MSGNLWSWRVFACAVAGVLYGMILAAAGITAAGAGHGTFVVIGVASSPLGLFQNVLVAWSGTPVLWCLIGFSLGRVTHYEGRRVFLLLMLAHYGSLFFILRPPSEFADWGYVSRLPGFFAGAIAFYAVGQIALWVAFCVILRKGKMGREETTP